MDWNIGKIVEKWADLTPDKAAVIFEDKPVTYRELNEGANRVAHCLQEKGLKKGDRISVFLLNCPEFLEIYFAAAKLGLVFAPLNFRLVGPELEYQINNCGSRFLAFHDSLLENVEPVRSSVEVPEGNFLFVKSGIPGCSSCPEWASDYEDVTKDCSIEQPALDEPVEFEDPLAIIYTSGVTGAPKGAVLSHEQTYFKNFQNITYSDIKSDDVYLSYLPMFHSGGLFITGTPTWCRGATVVTRQTFKADQFAMDIEKYKATIVFALTTMWRFVLQSGNLGKADTSSVRVALGGGERTPQTLLDELSENGIDVQTGYGQTENSFMTLIPAEYISSKEGSIGKPGFFTEMWIEDKNGKKLPADQIGEIMAKGPVVMSGYWDMPERTAEAIVNGALHTGDYGYMDEDGFFYIVDRIKDMYRSGGENVYPAEIEKVLADHPKIFNVAIIGVPDDKWGETGMAFIVLEKGAQLTLEEIQDYLKGKVAKFKFPARVKFVDSLPMTGSGKVMKVKLKEEYGARLDR
jgi:fatty-acyl-CoA synthase